MNVTSPSTFISTVGSLFWKRAPQPTFVPVVPIIPTQVIVTRDTTTHVDPPSCINTSSKHETSVFSKGQEGKPLPLQDAPSIMTSKKQQVFAYPETPRAPKPYHTTFALAGQDWNAAGTRRYCEDNRATLRDVDLGIPPGQTILCHPTEPGVYTVAEPKTLARTLFVSGFIFPAFWIVGSVIMFMPLRTTADWEAGKSSLEIEWGCSVIRNTELRWAKRCLVALLLEVVVIILVVAILKWGTSALVQ